jgi:hypothetical protein
VTEYHVTLNGQGYILDLGRYRKRIHTPFAPKSSTASESFAAGDLRGPEQLFVVSDWSGGEGYVQQDAAHPGRWRQGSGLDGSASVNALVGGLRLGPTWSTPFGLGQAYCRLLCVYGGKLVIGDTTGQVFTWDGTSAALIGTMAGPATCGEVFLNKAYLGNTANGKLASWDGTTFTATAATAAGPITTLRTHYRQAAQYLYVGAQSAGTGGVGRIYYWDGATLSSGQFDTEEVTPAASFVLGSRCYFVGADSAAPRWAIYSVDNTGSGGAWRCHARLTGGYGWAAAVLGDTAYITDGVGGRVWAFDGESAVTLVRQLSSGGASYGGILRAVAAWRGALWVGIRDGSGLSILRYDGVGWSRPVTGITGTDPEAMVVWSDQLWMGTIAAPASGVAGFANPLTFRASGTLDSGLVAFGLPGVSKLLRSVTLVCSAIVAPQTIRVEYQLEDTGGWTTLGTLSTVGATTATYGFAANTTCRQVAFRLTLTGTAGASVSPTLYQLAVRYVPRPAVTREWDLAVCLEGTAELPLVTLDGAAESLTGAQLTSALWGAAGSSGPVSLVDLDGASYSVYVQDLREEVARISQRKGYQRLGLVTLVEAA